MKKVWLVESREIIISSPRNMYVQKQKLLPQLTDLKFKTAHLQQIIVKQPMYLMSSLQACLKSKVTRNCHIFLYNSILKNYVQQKINKLFSSLKTSKSQGPDRLHPCLLKELCDKISSSLEIIYKNHLKSINFQKFEKRLMLRPYLRQDQNLKHVTTAR